MDIVIEEIRRMREGDEDALERIIDRYLPLVKGVTARVLGPLGQKEMVGECVNDVFFSVWRNIGKFKGQEESDFRRWLCAVAKYRAVDAYRIAVRDLRTAEGGLAGPAENGAGRDETARRETDRREAAMRERSAEETAILQEDRRELESLMKLLSREDRQIFIMKFFWGMQSAEIAERTGLSQTAVDNRVSRGRKRLRQERQKRETEGAGR
ncbi:sigma-70 family RNA polymerase sigma factor [Bacilliculturomica massiliensis]|uniref:sigma-70 family RNA polymerase sigma factor n=1 Tax=Bacilliculturomica massiliensis TaxID=1917867 RepID=UPI00102F9846|nr:sigma-70 family RNA polymerase sigma factor [Bacilliculturomica massiliensis]